MLGLSLCLLTRVRFPSIAPHPLGWTPSLARALGTPVPLDQDLSALLSHWLDMAILNRLVSMHPPTPVVVLMTDASLFDRSCLLLPHRVDAAWGQELVAFSMIGWTWGPFTCLFTSPSFPGCQGYSDPCQSYLRCSLFYKHNEHPKELILRQCK